MLKGGNKEESEREGQGIHFSRMEIYIWLLKDGINKMDINTALPRVEWAKGTSLLAPPTLKGPKLVFSIYLDLEKFKKPEDRNHNEKQSLGATVRPVNPVKEQQKDQGPFTEPPSGTSKPFAQK